MIFAAAITGRNFCIAYAAFNGDRGLGGDGGGGLFARLCDLPIQSILQMQNDSRIALVAFDSTHDATGTPFGHIASVTHIENAG